MRQTKALPQHTRSIKGRTVTGIFSVFGNIDSYGDIIQPGAFAATLQRRAGKILHLWMHDFFSPPIATIDSIREITRDELPEAVRAAFPEATGGMEVTRTYADTPRGNEVLALLQAGSPLEMSFAFDTIAERFEERGGRQVRLLQEVELFETSDVSWGANSATVASKARQDMQVAPERLQQAKMRLAALRLALSTQETRAASRAAPFTTSPAQRLQAAAATLQRAGVDLGPDVRAAAIWWHRRAEQE